MNSRRTRGMTLVEMIAAITVLMIMTAILAEVFLQATKAAAKGKGLAEIYQVDRALRNLMARDLSGASATFLESRENGLSSDGAMTVLGSILSGMPPGPYHRALSYAPALPLDGAEEALMRRMLMGGSDYMAFTSGSAAATDKAVAKVYYVLRETGDFVRVAHGDSNFTSMDYTWEAVEQGYAWNVPSRMDEYESTRVIAQNVERLKFSFLDRSNAPVSANAYAYAGGRWVDDWDWSRKPYLPAAVKVQLQLVDHTWNLNNDDRLTNRGFSPYEIDDFRRASESFDADDGEVFTFVIEVPLGMK